MVLLLLLLLLVDTSTGGWLLVFVIGPGIGFVVAAVVVDVVVSCSYRLEPCNPTTAVASDSIAICARP